MMMDIVPHQEPQRNSNQSKSNPDTGIIAEWPLKRHERLRISLELFNGVWLINSRKWFETESGEWRPSKQGIALCVKHLPQLADAVTKALSIARERGLIPVDSEAEHA
jgi:Transcriptional Coactivator p15 (PC4)